MPWTFAHPAAILPLRNIGGLRLPLAALVIGSLAPDFGYYLGFFQLATFAHSWLGILVLCLPTGAVVLALFAAIRHDLVRLLPQPHRGALVASMQECHSTNNRPSMLLANALGLCVGAATHAIWDSLTHASGLVVHLVPALQTHLFTLGSRKMHVYNLLQHTSTIIGLLAMLLTYRRWLAQSPPNIPTNPTEERSRYAVLIGCLALACASGLALAIAATDGATSAPNLDIFRIVIRSTNTFAVLLCLSAMVWRWRGDGKK